MSARHRTRHRGQHRGPASAPGFQDGPLAEPLAADERADAAGDDLATAQVPPDGVDRAEPRAVIETTETRRLGAAPTPVRNGPAAPRALDPDRAAANPGRDERQAEHEAGAENGAGRKASCTVAQLRRFIKSRPYVPLHELRRRFGIEGPEDEVGSFRTDEGTYYVGLPQEEAALLGELVRGGEVGVELLLDPASPAVIGVFPMRPVARG